MGNGFRLEKRVIAHVRDGRVVDLTGDAESVAKVREQLEAAGKLTGQDAYQLSSWHGGVNPQSFTVWQDTADLSRWQTLAHNNPRLVHFHIVGEETPGEISLPLLDPTVTFDGKVFWEKGTFKLLDHPAVQAELANYKSAESPFDLNRTIGI